MRLIYILFCFVLFYKTGFAQKTKSESSSTEERVNPYAEKPLLVNQFMYFDAELVSFDFNEFKQHFHQRNIDLLEKSKLLWGLEYGVQYKKVFFGAKINFGSQKGSVTDSIDAKNNFTRFGLSGGYYFVNTNAFQVMPRAGILLNNMSLKNFSSKKDIPLDQYTSNPDFKLNFQQYIFQLGLDINYKIHKISTKPGQPFLIGIKAAYNLDIGHTRVTSDENILKSDADISIIPLTIGLHFTILL